MNKRKLKIVAKRIGFHLLVLLKGFVKALYGALMTAVTAMAVYGFVAVPSEGGYAAVLDFVGAMACLSVAFGGMYLIGGKKKNNGGNKR